MDVFYDATEDIFHDVEELPATLNDLRLNHPIGAFIF
jgi:hypothetical protein